METIKTLWVIGHGDFVEFRRASKLTKKTSTLKVKPRTFEMYSSRRLTFKQVFYIGGKVIGFARARKFQRTFNIKVKTDQALAIHNEYHQAVIPTWLKRQL